MLNENMENNDLQPQQIRVSIQTPGAPRFVLTFTPRYFVTIKTFIQFICHETGLLENSQINRDVEIVGTPSYLLMLEEAILLNM